MGSYLCGGRQRSQGRFRSDKPCAENLEGAGNMGRGLLLLGSQEKLLRESDI